MFTVAVALCALFANGAQVKWSCANVFDPSGVKSTGVGYMFAAENGVTVDAVKAVLAGTDSGAAATYFAANAISTATPAPAGAYAGPATDYASGSHSFFVVIFDASSIADSSSFYITTEKSASVPGSGSATVAFGNLSAATSAAGAYTAAGWATPEPTSGMLLLLGGALLALRRKQK